MDPRNVFVEDIIKKIKRVQRTVYSLLAGLVLFYLSYNISQASGSLFCNFVVERWARFIYCSLSTVLLSPFEIYIYYKFCKMAHNFKNKYGVIETRRQFAACIFVNIFAIIVAWLSMTSNVFEVVYMYYNITGRFYTFFNKFDWLSYFFFVWEFFLIINVQLKTYLMFAVIRHAYTIKQQQMQASQLSEHFIISNTTNATVKPQISLVESQDIVGQSVRGEEYEDA